MVTYYNRLKDAFQMFAKKSPASSAQLLMLHLLHLHNENMNCGTVQVTDRDLVIRTRLNKNTITESKRTLKNLGLIDFKTDKHSPNKMTTYFFPEKAGQSEGQMAGQTLGQSGCVCHTQHASAMGGESFPPAPPFKEDLRLKTAPLPPQGATADGEGSTVTQANGGETVKVTRKPTEAESLAEFVAEETTLAKAEEQDIFKVWHSNRLPWLGASQKYRLSHYEEKYGFEKVSAAIIATKDKYTHPTFERFKEELDKAVGVKKPQETAQQAADEFPTTAEDGDSKAERAW